jgi:lipoprotein-releasing system permease protein
LTKEEVAYLFSTDHRDKLWQRYKDRVAMYDADEARALEGKLPPPVVVGIQSLLGTNRLIRYGSLINLTTYSPQKGELKSREFLVVGAFHTGLFEVDLRTVYMPLGAACEFVDLFDETLPDEFDDPVGGWRISGVGIALEDYADHKDDVIKAVQETLREKYQPRVRKADPQTWLFDPVTQTWEERKKTLLRAVKIEKAIVSLIIFILMVFAGGIIFLILTLNVSEKRRDLGILKAVGSHGRAVFTIFILHGVTICLLGLILGFLSGLLFCQHINNIHDFIGDTWGIRLFPPDVYYLDRIPVSIEVSDVVLISGLTVLFAFLGSLLPAIWAARQDPIQAIRFE